MNQTIGAYLDCLLWIVFGVLGLMFAPAYMRKHGKGDRIEKNIKMVKIGGGLILAVGLIRLASRFFGWGL
jgi:hypothetical protein